MPEKVMPGPVCDAEGIREAVCIHTKKILDACRERDIALARTEQARLNEISRASYISILSWKSA